MMGGDDIVGVLRGLVVKQRREEYTVITFPCQSAVFEGENESCSPVVGDLALGLFLISLDHADRQTQKPKHLIIPMVMSIRGAYVSE